MWDNKELSVELGEDMDKLFLSRINKYLKRDRETLNAETICTYYRENNYLEISFDNGQCSYDKQVFCTMCDYGIATQKHDVSVFIKEMLRIYNMYEGIKSLMLCTNGSFLDDRQMPLDFQKSIMEAANNLSCKNIYIETHYSTITDSKLELLREIFHNKTIKIELGLETVNEYYQEYILNKKISIKHFADVIKQIQTYGYTPIVNLLVGLPFLGVMTITVITKHLRNSLMNRLKKFFKKIHLPSLCSIYQKKCVNIIVRFSKTLFVKMHLIYLGY